MKILLISNMYPSSEYPTYGIFIKNAEQQLSDNGYNVTKAILTKKDNKIKKIIGYLQFYINIILKLLWFNYDVIYVNFVSHCAFPVILCKKIKKNLNIISNVHGNDIIPKSNKELKLLPLAVKLLELSDKIIAPSVYFKDEMCKRYYLDPDTIAIYPSGGIDTSIFHNININTAKGKVGLKEDYKYVGYVSRIDKRKGWDVFLDAIFLLKDKISDNVRFVVVGNGKEKEKFENRIDELGIRNLIDIYDLLEHSKLCYMYNSLDIFCFTTYANDESLGLVGLEAMSCGTLTIASNIAGPSTYVKDGENGFLFEAQNSKDLAEKISKVLYIDEEKRNILSKNAEKAAQKYDKKNVGKNLCDIFETVKAKATTHEFCLLRPADNTISNIYKLLLLVLPFIDALNGIFLIYEIPLFDKTGQIFRIINIVLFIYIICKYGNIKNRLFTLGIIVWGGILCLIHQYITNVSGNLFTDFMYYTKLFLPFGYVWSFSILQKRNILKKDFLDSMINYYSYVFILSVIIPFIIGIGYSSYELGGGYRGFYYANNEINIVLCFTTILCIDKMMNSLNAKNIILVILANFSLILIGSKTSIIVTVIIWICYLIKYRKKYLHYLNVKRISLLIGAMLLGGCTFSITFYDEIQQFIARNKYYWRTLSNKGGIVTYLLSARNLRAERQIEDLFSNAFSDKTTKFLFGSGYTKLVELDLFDLILMFGIVTTVVVIYIYICIFYKKKHIEFKYKLSICIFLLFSLFAGHVMFSALAGSIMGLILTHIYLNES